MHIKGADGILLQMASCLMDTFRELCQPFFGRRLSKEELVLELRTALKTAIDQHCNRAYRGSALEISTEEAASLRKINNLRDCIQYAENETR